MACYLVGLNEANIVMSELQHNSSLFDHLVVAGSITSSGATSAITIVRSVRRKGSAGAVVPPKHDRSPRRSKG
jgi:hypothetical protein